MQVYAQLNESGEVVAFFNRPQITVDENGETVETLIETVLMDENDSRIQEFKESQ